MAREGAIPLADDVCSLARTTLRTGLDLVTVPMRWRAQHWVVFFAVAATAVIAYVQKRPVQAFVESGGDGGARALALVASACGGGFAVTALGLAAFVGGRWGRKRLLVETAFAFGAAGTWCWICVAVGQLVLAERRPNDGGVMKLFALAGHGVSGHAAAAALLFWPVRDVLARGVTPRFRLLVTAALLGWAALVGWSRMWLGMHFAWNVELGLAAGFFTGFVATRAAQHEKGG